MAFIIKMIIIYLSLYKSELTYYGTLLSTFSLSETCFRLIWILWVTSILSSSKRRSYVDFISKKVIESIELKSVMLYCTVCIYSLASEQSYWRSYRLSGWDYFIKKSFIHFKSERRGKRSSEIYYL